MTSHTRRDDRPTVDHWDRSDHRRNRSATLPANPYDPRAYPPYSNDPRRPHRQDPLSYHTSSKAYQHATRPSAQPSYHPQPSSYQPAHPVASSSRRPHQDAPDPRAPRRPPPSTHQPYDQVSSGEEMPRASKHPSRSAQPSHSAQTYWNPTREAPSRRPKDAYRDQERDRERDRDRDRERDRPTADLDSRYKDRTRSDRHRERAPDVRYPEPSRTKYQDRRKDPDTEGVLYPEQRNVSRASLSGREGYPSIRESGNSHRRHRTEDGIASTQARRHQPENTQNPITSMPSASVPQPEVRQTGEPPPPAPRVMPVHLPPKVKPQRSHRDARPSTTQVVQPSSDTERVTGKYRMERTPSGPAVHRSDPHASNSRANHDVTMSARDDAKRAEGKHGVHHDARQPLAPINVDIPLVTPGFNASSLPPETKTSTVPQIVSIRAGQGPSDPHDAHSKSSAILHSDAPQEIITQPPHSASIIGPSVHSRPQSFETRVQPDRPVVLEPPRVEPHGDDPPPGQRMLTREINRPVPAQISKSHSYARGNPETGVDPSYPHSRPPSRSAHRTSTNNAVPPAVVGPRPLRSISQGQQPNELPTRPPSVAQYPSAVLPTLNQYSVPPSPAHPTHSSPSRAGHIHGISPSAQPSPKNTQPHGVSLSHSPSTQQAPSAPSSIHPTPAVIPQTLATSSRPTTRDSTDAPRILQQHTGRQAAIDDRSEPQQTSNGTTVKASWVVQTPATAKRAKVSREEKYLRDHHLNSDTPRAQLRQVLSQDDPYPRVSSLMMKASQATTPSAVSQRSSQARDVTFGTPRGTFANNSPMSVVVKETSTPEHALRQNPSPHLAPPPQIAVVGATPDSMLRDLPQNRVDHALLAPPFPAPTLVSRTASSSQDHQLQRLQPAARDMTSASYQPQPSPAVHAPSLFQPYRPPSFPSTEDDGQFSPPPLPIPPPRSPEDSPPPPIETRESEIIPARSQTDGIPQSHVPSIPVVQSEMFHVPSLPSASFQSSSLTPPRAQQVDNAVLTPISNGFFGVAHTDARSVERGSSQPDDIQVTQRHIIGPIPVLPSQSSASSTRSRPKVTIEDIPEDRHEQSRAAPADVPTTTPSAPSSKPQSSHYPTFAYANLPSKAAMVDQPSHRPSPQFKNKDSPPPRSSDPNATPASLPIPPPISTAPASTRAPSSAPPSHPIFSPSQAASTQRATSHAVSSRTNQRATEMLQASKLAPAPTNLGVVDKPAAAPLQATHNLPGSATDQHQPVQGANVQGSSASRAANTLTTTPHPSTSAIVTTTKVAAHTTNGASTSAGALGLHVSAPPTSINTQLPSAPDPLKQQPSRSGVLSIPTLDTTSTSVMPSITVKNVHQEQAIIDSTRTRDVTPSATRHPAPSSHVYPLSARPGASSATTQQTPAQLPNHHRVASLPATSSSTPQRPSSPRKYSQPIPTVSTQPFPPRPSVSESQQTRVTTSGHVVTPTPVRLTRPPPPDRHDSDILKTPSSIAPSPMLNPDTSKVTPQPTTVPSRTRKASTDSKDDEKKPSGLFRLFRPRTLSSKAADPPVVSTATRRSLDQGRIRPDASGVASASTSVPHGVTSTTTPKERDSATQPTSTSRAVPELKLKGRVPELVAIPPPRARATREHKDTTPHIFTPFKFLHSKRNRTVSAASLDVCDGNTATNTVVGSPDHSAISQAQPLPHVIPPGIRDPLVAASEWREKEEAERRERRTHRIRRPGVTFDLEEDPPSPAPGTAKRKRLVRRSSGRAPTPGPPRS